MLKYIHDHDNLGGFPKVWSFNGLSSVAFRQRRAQRTASEDYPQYDGLAYRREFFEAFCEKGKKTGAKAEKEKWLNYKRITFIIFLIMKRQLIVMRNKDFKFHRATPANKVISSSIPYLSNDFFLNNFEPENHPQGFLLFRFSLYRFVKESSK